MQVVNRVSEFTGNVTGYIAAVRGMRGLRIPRPAHLVMRKRSGCGKQTLPLLVQLLHRLLKRGRDEGDRFRRHGLAKEPSIPWLLVCYGLAR